MSETVLIRYMKPSLYRIGDFRLIAGMNEIKADVWKAVENNPGVVARIARGEIVVKSGPVQKKVEPKEAPKKKTPEKKSAPEKKSEVVESESSSSLADYTAKEACEIVSETMDVETLRKWSEAETRKRVLAAIEKQLETFAPTKEGDPDVEADETEST